MKNKISKLLKRQVTLHENFGDASFGSDSRVNQIQTKKAFSEKWSNSQSNQLTEDLNFINDQRKWFLEHYGFSNLNEFQSFFDDKIILDAGCGIGFKAAWIADMAPNSIIVGMDISESINIAAEKYKNIDNLFFIKGDILKTPFKNQSFDMGLYVIKL